MLIFKKFKNLFSNRRYYCAYFSILQGNYGGKGKHGVVELTKLMWSFKKKTKSMSKAFLRFFNIMVAQKKNRCGFLICRSWSYFRKCGKNKLFYGETN